MEAYLYKKGNNGKVECMLCAHRCTIAEGRRGICGVRENKGGTLYTLVYDKVVARNVDPIEKKPLFQFYPGTLSYSIATVGCNFKCTFCQNADIAQMPADRDGMIYGNKFSPETIVEDAIRTASTSIAYTYTEPSVYFELAYDTAKLAHEKGLKNVFVTNGYMTKEALEFIGPYLDAANVDLKAYSDDYYRQYCKSKIEPVRESLRIMKSLGVFIEVTTLIIPGLNDDPEELESLAGFLVDELGPETPWHISRFHPTYKLVDRNATPANTLTMARDIGIKRGLHYVYTGNVRDEKGENTYCYSCGKMLIHRIGFQVRQNLIENSQCPYCSAEIHGRGL